MWIKVLSILILISASSQAAERGFLRLTGLVPPRAEVNVEDFDFDSDFVGLRLTKNMRRMNFRLLIKDHRGRHKKNRLLRQFVLSQRGERRRLDLRPFKKSRRRVQLTVLSP